MENLMNILGKATLMFLGIWALDIAILVFQMSRNIESFI